MLGVSPHVHRHVLPGPGQPLRHEGQPVRGHRRHVPIRSEESKIESYRTAPEAQLLVLRSFAKRKITGRILAELYLI